MMSYSEKTSSNSNIPSLNCEDERLLDPDAGKSEVERAAEVCSRVSICLATANPR